MAYLKVTRYGCRPLGYGPLVPGGEPVLAWQHVASGRRVFTCPDVPGFGWRIEGDASEAWSNSLLAVSRRVERYERAGAGGGGLTARRSGGC